MRFVLLFALAASAGFTVLADDSQFIVVNTETKTTEPVFPTVNVNYNQSIAIRVVNKKDFKGTTKIFIAPGMMWGRLRPSHPPLGSTSRRSERSPLPSLMGFLMRRMHSKQLSISNTPKSAPPMWMA